MLKDLENFYYLSKPLHGSFIDYSELDVNLGICNGYVIQPEMFTLEQLDGCSGNNSTVYINGYKYILKDCQFSYNRKQNTLAPLCEYVGSRFMQYVTGNCQRTWLCYFEDRVAVICKDFTKKTALKPFQDLNQSSIGTSLGSKDYTYTDVLHVVKQYIKLDNEEIKNTISQFWKMFLVDAVLGNRDRHGGNWGFLRSEDSAIIAPIFDNGASLFPNVDFSKALDKEFFRYRIFTLPASQFLRWRSDIKDRPMRTNYLEVIKDYSYVPEFKVEFDYFNSIDIKEAIKYAITGLTSKYACWFQIIIYCRFNCLIKQRDFDTVYKEALLLYDN